MRKREPAFPVLIQDLISSTKEETTSEDGYVKTSFVSITGARLFRVVIAGVLMDMTDIGSEESPIFRLRVADPTGGVTFTVGRYSPDIQRMIPDLRTTYPIVVVGKVTSFTSKSGEEVVTLNPELIREVSKEERSMWNMVAVRDALSRIWKLEGRGPLPSRWMEVPRPDDPRGGEEIAERSRSMVRDTLRFLNKSLFAKELDRIAKRSNAPGDEEADDGVEQYESMVLDMINELDRGSGTRWDDLVDLIDRNRLSRDIVEEVVSTLLDKGLVYEPVLGYLKAI
ncbi:MAG: hypothetical protein ACMUHM_04860 [Thermoplasmatota archaeon]